MDKEPEIYFFCDEMRFRLDELKRDIEFLVTSLTNNPETDFRNKRVTAQLDQIQSKCLKLHALNSDILKEVNGRVKTV